MSLKLRESFAVGVPPERVWAFLVQPARVALCLPGAELTESVDAHTHRGRVRVKVGAISTLYEGTARLTALDERLHRMELVADGREVGAAGAARMSMVGIVSAGADGGSLVEVDATIDIVGRVMQIGRGLVESVSRQLFRQFAAEVRRTLEAEAGRGPATAGA